MASFTVIMVMKARGVSASSLMTALRPVFLLFYPVFQLVLSDMLY